MKAEEFIGDTGNWGSHRHLLWQALEAVKHLKLPILELGCGDGSTPFLRQYCQEESLVLFSYDYHEQWAKKFNVAHVTDWEKQVDWNKQYGVALVDESPGEHRKVSLMAVKAKIIVIHDSEPIGWNSSNYEVRPLFNNFKYFVDRPEPKPAAWTSALSNEIDVTKFIQ